MSGHPVTPDEIGLSSYAPEFAGPTDRRRLRDPVSRRLVLVKPTTFELVELAILLLLLGTDSAETSDSNELQQPQRQAAQKAYSYETNGAET